MKEKLLLKCVAIALFLSPFSAIATDSKISKKQYPPYPDVWGYDLSQYQAINDNDSVTNSYKMDNGDYWFEFVSSIKRKDPTKKYGKVQSIKYGLLKFFEGSIKELTEKESDHLVNTLLYDNQISKYKSKQITFSNGHTLELEYEVPGARMCTGDKIKSSYFVKRDEKGKELGRYSILVAMPKVETVEDTGEHSIEVCGMPSDNDLIYKQLYLLSGGLIKLEDDTFLLYDDYNIIARFDQNLNTKFKPKVNYKTRDGRVLGRNLFVIPYDVINTMYWELREKKKPWIQGIHDGLIEYIIENQNS